MVQQVKAGESDQSMGTLEILVDMDYQMSNSDIAESHSESQKVEVGTDSINKSFVAFVCDFFFLCHHTWLPEHLQWNYNGE